VTIGTHSEPPRAPPFRDGTAAVAGLPVEICAQRTPPRPSPVDAVLLPRAAPTSCVWPVGERRRGSPESANRDPARPAHWERPSRAGGPCSASWCTLEPRAERLNHIPR
jgi:hypothetical protein